MYENLSKEEVEIFDYVITEIESQLQESKESQLSNTESNRRILADKVSDILNEMVQYGIFNNVVFKARGIEDALAQTSNKSGYMECIITIDA